MRRVLVACWGPDASQYVGRRVTLFCDPDVIFGKDKVGGTRIQALSHIEVPKSIPLLVSRGKSATYVVQPLTESAPEPIPADWTLDQLQEAWKTADPQRRVLIEARAAELKAAQS